MTQTKNLNALSGLLVVSLEQAVAAPLCSSRLADAGARVIKIERKVGDFARGYDSAVNGQSSYFVWNNRGKESLELNIKQEEDKELLESILCKADVFIQNLAPGAAKRAGFGSEDLRKRYPKLVTCDISGYGEGNSYQDMKAYDLLIQSESGLVSVSGGPESYGRIGVSLCDIGAGLNATIGIQQALLQREKTGVGSSVKVSLFDSATELMSVPILQEKYTGTGPKRAGLKHPSIAPYGEFTTADNKIIVVAVQNEREWKSFCENTLEMPALYFDERFNSNNQRVKNRSELEQLIQEMFLRYSAVDMAKKLRESAVAYGSLNQTQDMVDHPIVRYTNVETEMGSAEIIAPPVIFDDQPPRLGAVPSIGQHTAQIKAEFTKK